MKIAIIGPTHPYKGGIAQHTTELAHHLRAAGHEVKLVSWKHQYPFFYPGQQFVPDHEPELPPYPETTRRLSWKNPVGWLRQARALRDADLVIFVWWVPTIQGPVILSMLQTLGHRTRSLILCHNVVSHESGHADKLLTRAVFRRADRIIVHTEALAVQARSLTTTPVAVAVMPAHFPGRPTAAKHTGAPRRHLLFFGLVRRYKGVDVLIRALANVPDVTLTVAGEMWGKQQLQLTELIERLDLGSRVELRPGYVAAQDIGGLFQAADALVMPYRSGTASQNAELAFAHGVPVIATTVGSMPDQIQDGFDGLLCRPEDSTDLAQAIQKLYIPGELEKLRRGLPPSHREQDWRHYIVAITEN